MVIIVIEMGTLQGCLYLIHEEKEDVHLFLCIKCRTITEMGISSAASDVSSMVYKQSISQSKGISCDTKTHAASP